MGVTSLVFTVELWSGAPGALVVMFADMFQVVRSVGAFCGLLPGVAQSLSIRLLLLIILELGSLGEKPDAFSFVKTRLLPSISNSNLSENSFIYFTSCFDLFQQMPVKKSKKIKLS